MLTSVNLYSTSVSLKNDDIIKVVNGDERAFDRFMGHYSSRLYYYAYGLLGHKEAAEEVVSDVFFEVWKNRKTLTDITSMNAWLQTITYRKSISYLRKEAGQNILSFDDISEFFLAPIQTPDEAMISREEMNKINEAIQRLPPKCKHVFFLAKMEGLPYKDIATLLNISVKTINNHIASALTIIARNLNIKK